MFNPRIFNIISRSGVIAAVSDRSDGNMGFSVGDDRTQVENNRQTFLTKLGIDSRDVAYSGQVHGDSVVHVSASGRIESCDAMFTSTQGFALAVSIADCLAFLLFDPITNTFAGVHSGWRGSAARIIQKTIARMKTDAGVDPKNLIAFISPGAGVCCYEVGEEVAGQFPAENVDRSSHAKPRLDLTSYNRALLIESGLAPSNIETSGACTICTPAGGVRSSEQEHVLGNPAFRFHSFRRDGANSGRMLAVIRSRAKRV